MLIEEDYLNSQHHPFTLSPSPVSRAYPRETLVIRAWIIEGQVREIAPFHGAAAAALRREETWMYFIRLPEGIQFPEIHRTWIFPTA